MTGSAGTAMDVVLRRRKAYKGGSLREGGSKIPPDGRLADSPGRFLGHGKTRVQIKCQNRTTDQEILEKQGYRSIWGKLKMEKKGVKKSLQKS